MRDRPWGWVTKALQAVGRRLHVNASLPLSSGAGLPCRPPKWQYGPTLLVPAGLWRALGSPGRRPWSRCPVVGERHDERAPQAGFGAPPAAVRAGARAAPRSPLEEHVR